MRTFVSATVAVLALAVAAGSQSASLATKAVRITAGGFSPVSVTIATGDAVKWTNRDTKNHQVVANNGAFASPIIRPGRSYTHTFKVSGTYRYHDALHPALTGRVFVTGPPPAVSIGASLPILTFGDSAHVSGQVSSQKSGEKVTVYAQPLGQLSPVLIATLLTGTNGVWDTVVNPLWLTSYQAHWKSTVSSTVGIAVRPKIAFSVSKRYGAVKVKAARSMAGRKVLLQRFTRFHQWITFKRIILGRNSGKVFRLRLKRGRWTLRVFMSYNQAGLGYLDGYSRTLVVRRR